MKESDEEYNENFISTSSNQNKQNITKISTNQLQKPQKNPLELEENSFSSPIDQNQIVTNHSCCHKFCFYLFCCCCCCSLDTESNFQYIEHWKEFLITEKNSENFDTPFIILTQLYTNQDSLQILNNLNKIRLNPNLISPIRNDLEFYIPQICTFLLYGGLKEIDEFFVFLCRVCNASFFFAHRVFWFLSAMIENSGEKKEMIENILNMINTIFLSEKENDEKIINKMYLSNSNEYVNFIKDFKLSFLYENSLKGKNLFDFNDENLKLNNNQIELIKKYKLSKEIIENYCENEYENCCKKKNFPYKKNNNNNNEISSEKKNEIDKKKLNPEDFFIDISNFHINSKHPSSESLDLNFKSYISSINFIDYLCELSLKLSKKPIDQQMPFLYTKINQINKKLPMNVYIPFLHNSCRNYVVVHIPIEEIKIFRTKTRAPIMLCFEIVRMDEINSNLNKSTSNLRIRSKSISSKNSSLISNSSKKFKDLNIEIDENLSKPLKLNENKNDIKININLQEIKEENENNRFLNIVNRFLDINNEEKTHRRLSVRNALNSTQIIRNNIKHSFMEEIKEKDDENEKNSNDLNKSFNKNNNNEIILNNPLSKSENKVEIINEKNNFNLTNQPNLTKIKSVFGETIATKHLKIKENSLFNSFKTHSIFRCIIKTNEDLRQEQFATQLINEFNQIFKLTNVKCWLNTYEIISTGNNCGLVEMCDNSLSIDQLKQKIGNISLHDFYLQHFGDGTEKNLDYKKALNNFISSLAGYSLVCYFLQIKDRHNGNILIDNEGHIIHIDFGFLLSNAPGKGIKFENAPFKLTNEMINCMGGLKGFYFGEFVKLLKKGFEAVYKHRSKIEILVEMMWCGTGNSLPCFEGKQKCIDDLKRRLCPRENMSRGDLFRFVDGLINQSVDNWRTKWYDMFQYYFQGIFY